MRFSASNHGLYGLVDQLLAAIFLQHGNEGGAIVASILGVDDLPEDFKGQALLSLREPRLR